MDKLTIATYPHKHAPFPHQAEDFANTWDKEYYAYFWEMGLGKSKIIIDSAAMLFTNYKIDGLLIVSDKGNYLNWYYREIPSHMPEAIPYQMQYYSAVMTRMQISDMHHMIGNPGKNGKLNILLINTEALVSTNGFNTAHSFLKSHKAMMVVDESTSIKNVRAKKTKSAIALSSLAKYRRIMTGTPIPQGPEDLYAQAEFLKRGLLGFSSFIAFQAHFCKIQKMYFGHKRGDKLIPSSVKVGYQNLDELSGKMARWSSRRTKAEELNLPPKMYDIEVVPLTEEQKRVYAEIRNQAVCFIENDVVSVTHVLSTLMKLHQIACGHVKSDDGQLIYLPNNRIPALIKRVKQIAGKAIIWANFHQDVNLIVEALQEQNIKAVTYYGPLSTQERESSLTQFKEDPEVKAFISTPATGGKGLTLTSANEVIYYSNNYSLEQRLQSEDRVHRVGQTKTVYYTDFISPGTVDRKIIEALRSKKNLAENILDNWRSIL